jgi:hypothetical protein
MAKNKSKKTTSLGAWSHFNIFAGLFFVLSFAIITSLSAYSTLAIKPAPVLNTPNLSLSPSSGSVAAGTKLSVQIWADSSSRGVNAVQVNLTYPIDKLNFVNIDTANTAFGVEAQSSGSNGVINIARGSTSSVTGKALVATVNFTPLAIKGKANAAINFSPGTVLLSATTNADILAATYGGVYSL